MKRIMILGILLLIMLGCSNVEEQPTEPAGTISDNQELIPDEEDLQALGMDEGGCRTEEYETHERAPLAQYSYCNYTIDGMKNTSVVLELKRYTNLEDLNGSYQYGSSHLFSAKGLISEDEYGDMSRFRVNSEEDYGGQYNEADIYYYHLWIVQDLFLIHITSSGSEEAGKVIERMGQQILTEFA